MSKNSKNYVIFWFVILWTPLFIWTEIPKLLSEIALIKIVEVFHGAHDSFEVQFHQVPSKDKNTKLPGPSLKDFLERFLET